MFSLETCWLEQWSPHGQVPCTHSMLSIRFRHSSPHPNLPSGGGLQWQTITYKFGGTINNRYKTDAQLANSESLIETYEMSRMTVCINLKQNVKLKLSATDVRAKWESPIYAVIRLLIQSIQFLLIYNGGPIVHSILCNARPLFYRTQVQKNSGILKHTLFVLLKERKLKNIVKRRETWKKEEEEE